MLPPSPDHVRSGCRCHVSIGAADRTASIPRTLFGLIWATLRARLQLGPVDGLASIRILTLSPPDTDSNDLHSLDQVELLQCLVDGVSDAGLLFARRLGGKSRHPHQFVLGQLDQVDNVNGRYQLPSRAGARPAERRADSPRAAVERTNFADMIDSRIVLAEAGRENPVVQRHTAPCRSPRQIGRR